MKEHRSIVIHWLMECSEAQRKEFHILMSAISEAAGMQSFRYGQGAIVKDRDRNLRRDSMWNDTERGKKVTQDPLGGEDVTNDLQKAQDALEMIINSRDSDISLLPTHMDTPMLPVASKEDDSDAIKPWWEEIDEADGETSVSMWPTITDDSSFHDDINRTSLDQ